MIDKIIEKVQAFNKWLHEENYRTWLFIFVEFLALLGLVVLGPVAVAIAVQPVLAYKEIGDYRRTGKLLDTIMDVVSAEAAIVLFFLLTGG